MQKMLLIALTLTLTVGGAMAETVQVDCVGSVEYNQFNSGTFADVNPGDAVLATFTLDSENYIESTSYGVRSYPINMSSYELTIGSVGPVPLVDPQPGGATVYFVVRDADPVADGFFLAGEPEWDYLNAMLDAPGSIDPYLGFHWAVGYEGDVLSSRDILDAVGTYGYDGLTSFYTAIQDAWADPMGLEYVTITISTQTVATESSSWDNLKAIYR
jgi:hypothetical protein